MNFSSKLSLFGGAALLAGILLSGCRTSHSDEPTFSDNPGEPAAMAATGAVTNISNDTSGSVDAALFQPGETVTVSTSTGTESDPGPIGNAQPYLIADDGTITLPLIGRVQAAGKSPGQLQDEIQKGYVPAYYVNLTVTVISPNRAYIVGGEVMHPGPEVYLGVTTLTTAIQAAGDLTQFASHAKIYVTRKDGTRIKVNYDKALRDSTQDPPIFPGDKIFVNRRYF